MKTVRFLHISDLHRGGPWYEDVIGDHKDKCVSNSFAGTLTASMEADFVKSLEDWQRNHGQIDAIVCSGDLGNRGDTSKIEEGLYFINLIQKRLGIREDNVLVCPGNHDADRNEVDSKVFAGYSSALLKYGYTDHLLDTRPFYINGIPFVVLNTSLGAAQKSLFIQKYKELANTLSLEDKQRFTEELKKEGLDYLDDSLDIPAITEMQSDRILKAINIDEASFAIMVMHHSLLPCNSIEIRPYSSVLDSGRVLSRLMNCQKDILIFHGHVHFPTASVLSKPNSIHFVSSVGAGVFNGASGSSVNIVEVFCSDEGEYIITVVYEFVKQVNGLNFSKPFSIYNQKGKDLLSIVLNKYDSEDSRGLKFGDLKKDLSCSEADLLRLILSKNSLFEVARRKSNEIDDWTIYRIS